MWAVVGALIAFSALPDVNADARLLVGLASALGPIAAFGAAITVSRHFDTWGGVLLITSVITPTYFAWVLNVSALLLGLILLLVPQLVSDSRSG